MTEIHDPVAVHAHMLVPHLREEFKAMIRETIHETTHDALLHIGLDIDEPESRRRAVDAGKFLLKFSGAYTSGKGYASGLLRRALQAIGMAIIGVIGVYAETILHTLTRWIKSQ